MDFPIVLVRFGEIALKSKYTRAALRRILRHNILATLKNSGISFRRIEDTWERLLVYTNESERGATASSRVFGVVSASPAVECKSEIGAISAIVSEMAKEEMKSGDSFAIRVRRVGKHSFTTNEVAVRCGSAVIEALNKGGINAHVNLGSPGHEFFIEARADRSFVYSTVIRGVGGLPLGSQGRVVSRLNDSGDILATWLMMKRGCSAILAVFSSKKEVDELVGLARSSLLPYSSGEQAILAVPLDDLLKDTDSVITKERIEYLALNNLASLLGAEGIVSSRRVDPFDPAEVKLMGEFVGIVDIPIFYPLIGLDEKHLGYLAHRIGGKELSAKIQKKSILLQGYQGRDPSSVTYSRDSFSRQYQQRISNAVLAALEKASLNLSKAVKQLLSY